MRRRNLPKRRRDNSKADNSVTDTKISPDAVFLVAFLQSPSRPRPHDLRAPSRRGSGLNDGSGFVTAHERTQCHAVSSTLRRVAGIVHSSALRRMGSDERLTRWQYSGLARNGMSRYFTFEDRTRNSAVADKPRDAYRDINLRKKP